VASASSGRDIKELRNLLEAPQHGKGDSHKNKNGFYGSKFSEIVVVM
jgi:hypothetical protein